MSFERLGIKEKIFSIVYLGLRLFFNIVNLNPLPEDEGSFKGSEVK